MAILDNKDLALPKGSLILVTGSTGFIAANIVREALDAGYRVRGSVRSEEKAKQMEGLLKSSDYESVIVPDMQPDGAYDQAVKNVDAIIHTASIVNFDANPNNVIPPTVQGAVGIMKSAAKESSVKRFVYTSSSAAAALPRVNTKFKVDKNSWADEIDHLADAQPPYSPEMGYPVYACSKLRAERAVWQFVKENKPQFVVNAVCPNLNTGRIIGKPGMTADFIITAYNGKKTDMLPPQWFIDVIDDARIHLAAAIDGSVANERIFAYAEPYNWTKILHKLQELKPDRTFYEVEPNEPEDISEVDNALGEALLKKWWGQEKYTSLKDSIRQNIEGL